MMAKSNLAFVEEVAEGAILSDRAAPRFTTVAGFRIAAESVPSETWAAQRKGYRADAETLRSRLHDVGVEPLAVLPAGWWAQMVEEVGLYDLAPDARGTVGISPKAEAAKADTFLNFLIVASPVMAAEMVAAAVAFGLPGNPWWLLGWVALAFVATVVVTMAFHQGNADSLMGRILSRPTARLHVARSGGDAAVMRRILDEAEPERRVGIVLPEPPAEVVDVLSRIAGMEGVRVAVEPGAVAFAEGVTDILALTMRETWRMRAEERARFWAEDPIVYVRQGSAVALVAQFGDCPIERALVDRVVSSRETIA